MLIEKSTFMSPYVRIDVRRAQKQGHTVRITIKLTHEVGTTYARRSGTVPELWLPTA